MLVHGGAHNSNAHEKQLPYLVNTGEWAFVDPTGCPFTNSHNTKVNNQAAYVFSVQGR